MTASYVMLACCGGGGKEDTGPDPDKIDNGPNRIPNEQPLPTPGKLACPQGTSLTYENFGQGFMLEHCTMCHSAKFKGSARHGATVGVDFDSARDIAVWNQAILNQAGAKATKMPPAGSVDDLSRALLTEWLLCGVPTAR